MRYDAVILDLDGTLLNTLPDIVRIVNSVIADIGMAQKTEDEIREAVGSGVEALLGRIGVPGQWISPLAGEIGSRYTTIRNSRAVVYPGIQKMLDALAANMKAVCVLSNKPVRGVYKSLEDHLGGYTFASVKGAMPGKPSKPAPDTLLEMLGEIGMEAGKALMVGDGVPDVTVAEASGTHHIGVLWGYRTRAELAGAGAVNFAETPGDVLRFIGI